MNCPNCGTTNLDNAALCINCGRPLTTASAAPPPPPMQSYTPPPPPPPGGSPGMAPPMPGMMPGPVIPNYLVHSIIATLCCCLPLGIVAIIFSAQVNQKLAIGDVAGAQDASNKAKLFCWISFGIGIIGIILIVMINGAALLATLHNRM